MISEFTCKADKISRNLTSHSITGPWASAEGLGVLRSGQVRAGRGPWQLVGQL